jgi:hypothetical protein
MVRGDARLLGLVRNLLDQAMPGRQLRPQSASRISCVQNSSAVRGSRPRTVRQIAQLHGGGATVMPPPPNACDRRRMSSGVALNRKFPTVWDGGQAGRRAAPPKFALAIAIRK